MGGGSRSQVLSSPWADLVVGAQSSLYLGGWWVTLSDSSAPFITLLLHHLAHTRTQQEFVIVVVAASASLSSA